MSDRNLGYFVLVFLLLLLLIPALSFSVRTLKPVHKTVIAFPSANTLNFLKNQDPVKVHGVRAGMVRKIYWLSGTTYVEIETAAGLDLHQGYRIIAEAKGFMGDRYLEIDPGDVHLPAIDPNEELTGRFPLGPAEAIAFADSLNGKLRKLIKAVDELRTGTPVSRPFAERFRNRAESIDTLSANLRLILGRADTALSRKVDTLASAMGKVDSFSVGFGKSVSLAESTAETIEVKSRRFTQAADSVISSVGGALRLMRYPESEAMNHAMDSVKAGIEALRQLTEKLLRSGIKVKL